MGLENNKSFKRMIIVFSSDTSFSNFATLISTAESALDFRIAVVIVGASVVIVGVGIVVVVCCMDEMIGVTRGEESILETGVSVTIFGIGGRLVVLRITDNRIFCTDRDWI
ncbi:hypothetical protein Tco_1346793 [Tanacetum coccineum]